MWSSKSSFKREVYRKNIDTKKQERYQTTTLSLHLKKLDKEQIEPKVREKKGGDIIKIKLEINEIENKKKKKKV